MVHKSKKCGLRPPDLIAPATCAFAQVEDAISHMITHTTLLLRLFNGLFSRTTCISRHEKGEPFWILLEQEMMGWQWHQLDHMKIICTSLQTDNHASAAPLTFYRMMPFLLPDQQHQAQH